MSTALRSFPIRRTLARSLVLALAGTAMGELGAVAAESTHADLPALVRHGRSGAGATSGDANVFVANCNDSGNGSLRSTMQQAHNNTIIDFSQLQCSKITLTTGALTDPNVDSLHLIAPMITISGGRPRPSITIDANGSSRVIEHHSGGELELVGLLLRNGVSTAGKGGCVYAHGRVQAVATTIESCVASTVSGGTVYGGGIWSDDQVDLLVSTISNSHAEAPDGGYSYGGGVFTSYGFSARYSTLYFNYAVGVSGVGYGGGVAVTGPALVLASVLENNTASYGAGIEMFGGNVGPGDLQIINSTITANYASGFAAGIETNGSLDVFNSTIASNIGHHAAQAGGISIHGAHTLNLVSSIVFGNTQAGVMQDIGGSGTITGSANLIGHTVLAPPVGTLSADPKLGPLADNGGQTRSMKLLPTSPAIDHGSNPTGALCDGRSGLIDPAGDLYRPFLRTIGATTDIGAYEVDSRDDFFGDGFEPPVPFDCYVP
jgi:hypothetical protein